MRPLSEFMSEALVSEKNHGEFYAYALPMAFDGETGIDPDDLWDHIYIPDSKKGELLAGKDYKDVIKQAEKLIKKNYDFPDVVAYSVYYGDEPINWDNYEDFDEETVIGNDLDDDAQSYFE